ncbi:MAG TPA: glycosyltransferase family 39 protein, partial [Pirellulales bacterium]|nr:glycosyltransferase family 39 protein [Pirellulales bacterium]
MQPLTMDLPQQAGAGHIDPRWPLEQPSRAELLSPLRQRQLIWAFVALGLAARAVRYLLRFPLWEDECFLACNFIDQTYAGLLRPLNYHQVAPLGFLWIELSFVKLLGFHEAALRLFAFAASVGSVLLFRQLVGRLLSGTAAVLAVAVFCVSYSGIRYAAEAKPYGPDQFMALVLLALAVEWWRRPEQRRWLPLLIVAVPAAVCVSYPAVFVAGGLSVWMAAVMIAERRRGWLVWLVLNAVLFVSFAAVFLLASQNQAAAELGYMQNFWKEHLPSLTSPLHFAWWLLVTH